MTEADARHMAHALALGRRGLGRTWPRPSVGCVIVRDGRVIARGRTDADGHAEAHALHAAGEAARGATAYVSLEPCAHHGRTPPCAEALVAAGVARVVTALEDPDPRVSGRGHAILRAAGITVETGVMADVARRDHAGFLMRTTLGRPFVTLKLAMSLDGRIATATGESRWITGPGARRAVHGLRLRHDAVMVGGGTARMDDPALTVRGFGAVPQPVRVVVTRLLDVPLMGQLARTATEVPVWLCHGPDARPETRQAWEGLGARLIACRLTAGRVDPVSMLQALGGAGLNSVFCEGGGQLAASLLANDLVDELQVFSAGLTLGAEGHPGIGALGVDRLSAAPRFELQDVVVEAGDVRHIWARRSVQEQDLDG